MKLTLGRSCRITLTCLLLAPALAHAQFTATWYGIVDSNWNHPDNWDFGVPAEGTNAMLITGTTVDYFTPMAASSFAGLSLQTAGTTLNVDAAGFTVDVGGGTGVPMVLGTGTALNLGANGVLAMLNTVNTAGLNLGVNGNNVGAAFIINGGSATFDKLVTVQGTGSRLILNGGTLICQGNSRVHDTSNDGAQRLVIADGVASLGNFSVHRSTINGGLIISNGLVTATGVQIGIGNARAYGQIHGGKLTVDGTMIVHDSINVAANQDRRSWFLHRGGDVEVTGAGGLLLGNQYGADASRVGGIYEITGGTLRAEKLTLLRDATLTNVSARLNGGAAAIYLGSGGFEVNLGGDRATAVIALTNTTLGASADWSSVADLPLNSGVITFRAADLEGAARNITLFGRLTGAATLAKTGAGTLTLHAANTCSGTTQVLEGSLVLGPGGSLDHSPVLQVAAGAVLDASAAGGLLLGSGRSLGGSGRVLGPVALGEGVVLPGLAGQTGMLTLADTLTSTGDGSIRFDLSGDPAGANDRLRVEGDLDLTGIVTLQVNSLATLSAGAVYPLIAYDGTLSGSLANFQLAGVAGTLTNGPGFIGVITAGARGPTNLVWVGNATANLWDTLVSTNWLNAGTLDQFVSGDTVRFDATGAANPSVAIVGSVTPAVVMVDAATDYTFGGTGTISGNGGLTKTNTGTLTVLTANDYTGPTVVEQGVLEVSTLGASGLASGVGASGSDPANLVLQDGALRYLGGNSTSDRGVTLADAGAAIGVANSATTLTLGGTLAGPGGLTKTGPGTLALTGMGGYEGVTTLSEGTLQVGSAVSALGANAIHFNGGTLRLAVGGQPNYPHALEIAADSGLISAGGNNNILSGPWSGAATLHVGIASGGVLTINRAFTESFTGAIALGASAGLLRFNSGGSDPCKGSPHATFDLGTGTVALVNRNGGTYGTLEYYLGALAGGPDTQLRGSENTGVGNAYVIGDNHLDTTFAGSIRNGAGGASALVTLIKSGSGTLTLSGVNTYGGGTIISNGVLALSGAGSIASSTNLHLLPGAAMEVTGRVDGTLPLAANRSLTGEGEIRGSLNLGGVLSPGSIFTPYGTLRVTHDLTLQPNSEVIFDLDPFTPTNDVVRVDGALACAGTIHLRLLGYPSIGQVFKLFEAATYAGAITNVTSDLDLSFAGLAWDASGLGVDGTLKVVALQPLISQVSVSGNTLTLQGTGGAPGTSFRVLVSTNVALPATLWTPVETNWFNFDGTFSYSDTIQPGQPAFFYLIATP